MTISKLISFCILFCLAISNNAQESVQVIIPIEYTIKASDYHNGSNEIQILSSLSINSIKNINQVRVYLKTELLLNVQRDEKGHLFAYMKMINSHLSGDIYFRDFLIDTLLMPLVFDGKLLIKNKERKILEMPIEILLSGGVLDLEIIEKYKLNIDELIFDVEIEKFWFSDEQLHNFHGMATIINGYYSYCEVLNLLLEQYGYNQLQRGKSSSSTFIAWHHINRVVSFIETYQFEKDLHLQSYDPKRFLEMWIQAKRLEQRASTLFLKELQKGRKGKLLDRNEYGKKYVDISKNYIRLSKQYQPNTVSAFNELVRIFPVENDLQRMSNVAKFYDVFKITGKPSTPQLIFESFVTYADSVLDRQEYLNAINLIRNASEIELFYKSVQKSDSYTAVYSGALNGLMSSFLKVSIMAYKSRNFKIAKRYYQQAQEIFNENADLIGDDYSAKNSFKGFINTQIELAYMFLNDKYYEDAILILDQTQSIGQQNALSLVDIDFTSAYTEAYGGIYKIMVDSIEYYLEKENKDISIKTLLNSARFEQTHTSYLNRDERVISYAQVLFNDFMHTGLTKLHGSSPENAMSYFIDAKNLNETFQLHKSDIIDSAISQAAVPIILQLINKASFEVWANRLDEAERLKKEAENLIDKYDVENNQETKNALHQLDEKIDNRICVDLQYKVDHAVKISSNRVHSGKYTEAESTLEMMYVLIEQHSTCEINTSEMDLLYIKYNPLFNFNHNYDSLINILYSSSFSDSKVLYEKLVNDYNKQKLEQFIKEMPDLLQLMKEKGQVQAYYEAVEYYIDKSNFEKAFNYLNLLRLTNINAKETKQYQKQIGYGICNEKDNKETYIKGLTDDNSWFQVLRTECLKN